MANDLSSARDIISTKVGDEKNHDFVETESSIFRAIEKEDLQRFGGFESSLKNIDTPRLRLKEKQCNSQSLKYTEKTREMQPKGTSGKALETNTKMKMYPKAKRNRFVQRRISIAPNLKSWHSDSELDSITKEQHYKAKHDAKFRARGRNGEKHPSRSIATSKNPLIQNLVIHEDKGKIQKRGRTEEILEVFDQRTGAGRERNYGNGNSKMQEPSNFDKGFLKSRKIHQANKMNTTFPSSMNEISSQGIERHFETSSDNRLLNLLIEYFKDLNEEVREFRKEKKKTRDQVQDIERKLEELAAKIDSREGNMTMRDAKMFVDHDSHLRFPSHTDIKQEVRNILSDVHSKYQKQLFEHETMIKCVQEKAEHDIQNLMKNIVENCVKLPTLKDKDTNGTVDLKKRSCQGSIDTKQVATSCKNRFMIKTYAEEKVLKTANNKEDNQVNAIPEKERPSNRRQWKQEDSKSKYQFYFPRQTRQPNKKDIALQDASEIPNISPSKNDSAIVEERKDGIRLNCSSPPKGLGTSYIEWKKFWCEKLQQRGPGNKVRQSLKPGDCEKNEPNRNTV